MSKTSEDNKIYMREYYLKNKDRIDSINKKWAIDNKEKNKEYQRTYYKENRVTLDKKNKEWKEKNRERYLSISRGITKRYRERHPDRVSKHISSESYKKFKRLHEANRRGAGKVSLEELQRIYEDNIKINGTLTCYLCGNKIAFGDDHIDHIFPIARGGKTTIDNLAIACSSCNISKRAKTLEEYLLWKHQQSSSMSM